MATKLLLVNEKYECDSEKEAVDLINQLKAEFNVTKYGSQYKYLKKEERDFYIVTVTKDFTE